MKTEKTINQLRLYNGLVNQLINAGEIKIDMGCGKEWRGDLWKYVTENYHTFKKKAEYRDMVRYLLKLLDTELPTRNPITQHNINKCHFGDATRDELSHHISWLKEQLWANGIVPFDEVELYKEAT